MFKEITEYFKSEGLDDKTIQKAINAIQNAAYSSEIIDDHVDIDYYRYVIDVGLNRGDEFYYSLARNFAPRHYHKLVEFVKAYEKDLETDWESGDDENESELDKQRRNFFQDDYEYGDVPGEVIVYSDRIEVHAFGWRDGFKESLPKGGEYQGKGSGCWHYPIEMREVFTQSDTFQSMPVLYADGEHPYR